MKALVTGATGFVGGVLARRLLRDGHEVRALVRSPRAAAPLREAGVEVVPGDVLAPATLEAAMTGRDALFHCAAVVDLIAPKRGTMLATNVEGTRNVLGAARRAGVRRTVYLSSVAALGLQEGSTVDESTRHDGVYRSPYDESKHRSEEVALQFAREGLDVVLVLPSVVIGPGDPKTGDVLLRFLRRGIPALPRPEGSAGYVHVDDLVEGILLAYERGRAGERYVFNQANLRHGELMEELARISGVPAPRRRVPVAVAAAGASLVAAGARLMGRRPPVTANSVRLAARRLSYSSHKAVRELGWRPQPFPERLESTVRWWMEEARRLAAA